MVAISLTIQILLRPFSNRLLEKTEKMSLFTCAFVLYAGTYFVIGKLYLCRSI